LAYTRVLVEAAKHVHDSPRNLGEVWYKGKKELTQTRAAGRKRSKPCPYQVIREKFKNANLWKYGATAQKASTPSPVLLIRSPLARQP
jgi:hypothetical protein